MMQFFKSNQTAESAEERQWLSTEIDAERCFDEV